MGVVIASVGVVAIAIGVWLVVSRRTQYRHSASVGILMLIVGIVFLLSAYWSSPIIRMGETTPTAQATAP